MKDLANLAVTGDLVDGALQEITRGEIDQQIATAHRYPRDMDVWFPEAEKMVTYTPEVAQSMYYVIPRGQTPDGKPKHIQGPSVRLAEVIACCYGNLRAQSRIIARDARFVTAQGVCHDLEKNVAISVETKRRITDKSGRTFSDDMIQVTANAACSIALRQSVFKVIPFTYAQRLFESAKKEATAGEGTVAQQRLKMLAYFAEMGVTEPQILVAVGVAKLSQIGKTELGILHGIATAIRDEDTTAKDVFAKTAEEKPKKSASTPKPSKPSGASEAGTGAVETLKDSPRVSADDLMGPEGSGAAESQQSPEGRTEALEPGRTTPEGPADVASPIASDEGSALLEEAEGAAERPTEGTINLGEKAGAWLKKCFGYQQASRVKKMIAELAKDDDTFWPEVKQHLLGAAEKRYGELTGKAGGLGF